MRPDQSFLGQPIRSLQTMLRLIGKADGAFPNLIPDGIYGPETVNAVSSFQRSHGLPLTGVTDLDTWETIVALYEEALLEQMPAQPLLAVLEPGQVIRKGDSHPHLHLAQGMLQVLSEAYDSIAAPSRNGILDEPTEDAISSFQSLAGLPATGQLDKRTWKHLALHYPLAVSRNLAREDES